MITNILIGIAGLFALIIVVGIFIPRAYRFHKTIVIKADKKHIFNTIDNLGTWKIWSQWSPERDPTITLSYSPETSGTNSWMEWKGKKMGAGKMEIVSTDPYREIKIQTAFNKGLFKMEFTFSLEEIQAEHYAVKWTVSGLTKRGGFAKILGRMLPKMMGKDMEIALKILQAYCEGKLSTTA